MVEIKRNSRDDRAIEGKIKMSPVWKILTLLSLITPPLLEAKANDDYLSADDMAPYLRRVEAAKNAFSANSYFEALNPVGVDLQTPALDLDRVIRESVDHFFGGMRVKPTWEDIENLMGIARERHLRNKIAEKALPYTFDVADIFMLIDRLQKSEPRVGDAGLSGHPPRTADAIEFAKKAVPYFLEKSYSLNDAKNFARFFWGADGVVPIINAMLKQARTFRQFREILELAKIPDVMAANRAASLSSGRYLPEILKTNAPLLLHLKDFSLTAVPELERAYFTDGFDSVVEFREILASYEETFDRPVTELEALTKTPRTMTKRKHLERLDQIRRAISQRVPIKRMSDLLILQVIHPLEPQFFTQALNHLLADALTTQEFSRAVQVALSGDYFAQAREVVFSRVKDFFDAFLAMEKDPDAAGDLFRFVGDTPSGQLLVRRYLSESTFAQRQFGDLKNIQSLIHLSMSPALQFGELTDFAFREILTANLPRMLERGVSAADINTLVTLPRLAPADRDLIFIAYLRHANSRRAFFGLKLPFELSPELHAAVVEKIPRCALPITRYLPVQKSQGRK